MSIAPERSRTWYAIGVVVTIGAGLASRALPVDAPLLIRDSLGDALYAVMVFLGLGFLFKRASTVAVAIGAFGFCLLIEVLKLYRAPWAVEIRESTLGHLVFGDVFHWGNVAAYLVGVGAAAVVEWGRFRRTAGV